MTNYQNQVVENLIKVKNSSKKNLFNNIYVFQDTEGLLTDLVLEAVAAMGEGFVVDVCKKAIEARTFGKKSYISEKQAWCIVYAFVKISDEALVEWYSNFCVETEEQNNETEESVEEQSNEGYVVKTSSANNEMNLHSTNEKELYTSSLDEALAMFSKEIEVLGEYYTTEDALSYSPSEREYANAIICEIFKISDGEAEAIKTSDYFFEK